jgi:hypothetical protein
MLRRRPLMGMRRRRSRRRVGSARSLPALFRSLRSRALTGSRRRRTRRGSGFLGDVWNGIKSVGSYVAPHVLPILRDVGVGLLKKRLGVGRRRRGSRRVSRRGGYASFPWVATRGMRRRRRRTRLGGVRRSHMIAGARRRRRRVGRSRVGCRRRRRVGRGPLGSLLGSILPW